MEMMVVSKRAYESFLDAFQGLAVRVGGRPFDLRWHNLSAIPIRYQPDNRGGWSEVEWPGLTVEDWPFDPATRSVVGQLHLPFDDTGSTFTLGLLDPVTLPRCGAAVESVTVKDGGAKNKCKSANDFTSLPCGRALAPLVFRDRLVEYCFLVKEAPANRWYGLLFFLSQATVPAAGRQIPCVRERACFTNAASYLG